MVHYSRLVVKVDKNTADQSAAPKKKLRPASASFDLSMMASIVVLPYHWIVNIQIKNIALQFE